MNCLVSDFDGSITRNDFFLLAQRYVPASAPDYFAMYRSGRITHFEAMAAYFSHIPADPATLEELVTATDPDPAFAESAWRLADAGWDLVIVSAGSAWYIERILERTGAKATVISNPGRIVEGRGLVLEKPARDSGFYSEEIGIDKAAVVRDALARYDTVAFAGDGPPDVAPALLVPAERRFARRFLAEELARRGEAFRRFDRWSDVANALLAGAGDSGLI